MCNENPINTIVPTYSVFIIIKKKLCGKHERLKDTRSLKSLLS